MHKTIREQSLDIVKVSGDGDINAGWTVNVAQPSSSSKYVLYDIEGDPVHIMGTLNANGQIYIFDQNGVIFGAGSQVNVGSIVASTGMISDANLADNKMVFENVGGNGEISLNGTINVAEAGLVAFVAPTIKNSGIINAKLGTVAMASGEKVTLDLYGDNLVAIAVDGALENSLIENKGTIRAEGGTVAITVAAAKDAVDNVINMEGVTDVSSVSVKGGKIILGGGNKGTVKVSGKLDASGTTGGDIKVTGQNVDLTDSAEIVNTGDNSNTYVYGTDKAIYAGTMRLGNLAKAEISGKELVLSGRTTAGANSIMTYDPANLDIDALAAATIVNDLLSFSIVNLVASDSININAEINSSGQANNHVLNLKDEDANNNLIVNLNAKILLGSAQNLTGDATVVNVANTGLIQNGVDVSSTLGSTVNVAAGTYVENVTIDKSNLTLQSTSGRDNTTITGITNGALGTIVVADNVNNVTIGGAGKGFTINGIDAPLGSEAAAVYLDGVHNNIDILNNNIVANGDLGLVSEWYFTNTDITIDSNTFSGNTFTGGSWATGDQWTVPNVSRQLVSMGPGSSDVKFTNNTITGNSGANTNVTIDSDNAVITGNAFMGTTTGGSALRVRGNGALVSGNGFDGTGLTGNAVYITAANSVFSLGTQIDITHLFANNFFVSNAVVSSTQIGTTDIIGKTIQGAIDVSEAGAFLYIVGGDYNESVYVNKANLTLMAANNGVNPNTTPRYPEATVNAQDWYGIYTDQSNITIDGIKVNAQAGGYGIVGNNANNFTVRNSILTGGNFGIFNYGGTATNGLIENNKFFNIHGANGQAIHIRDNQYATIRNNVISDVDVGIATENFSAANPTGLRSIIDNNTISSRLIGIRNNLSYGGQTGFTISNNTITAEDTAATRRWTGIDVISQQSGAETLFNGNNIDGSAVDATRQTSGFELTNMTNASRAIINGGSIKNVDTGVWATDGSFYTGAVTGLLIKNVAFSDIGFAGILAEDTEDTLNQTGVNPTGTAISIGAGNTFTNTAHELAIGGDGVSVNLEEGFTGFNSMLVRAAGPANFTGNPSGTTTTLTTNNASINQGIGVIKSGGTVTVEAGAFTENVIINKSMTLQSITGRDTTTINGISGVGALGTVQILPNVNDVKLGTAGKGFTINGIDNGFPGVENAAIYLQGAHDKVSIKDNRIVAMGDEALVTEYGLTNSNMIIDNNIFTGTTYFGVAGTGDQFTDPNVARQLVALNNGLSNLTFTNNQILGTSGEQHLVAIESDGATITGNNFDGTTTGALLRLRGSDITVSDNDFDGNNTAATGIRASDVAGLTIGGATLAEGNTIKDIALGWTNSGINILNGSGVSIANNTLNNIGGQGIYAEGPYGGPLTQLDIKDNNLTNVEHNAIYIKKWNGANVEDNVVDGTTYGNGILLELTQFADVVGNTVKNVAADGIQLWYGNSDTKIDDNDVDNTGKDGISVYGSTGVTKILNNRVGLQGIANSIGSINGGDAIFVSETDGSFIQGNKTANTKYNGPARKGSGILVVKSDNTTIGGTGAGEANDISLAGSDGIVIRNDGGSNDGNKILNNVIHGATGSRTGIYAENATNTTISGNNVSGSGRYAAIYGYGGESYAISGNTLKDNQEQGIRLENVSGTNTISGNFIDKTGTAPKSSDGSNNGNAIHAVNVAGLTISGNNIGLNGGDINGDGVYVRSSNGVVIKSNKINDTDFATADANGANGSGIQVVDTAGVTIGGATAADRNTITNAEWDGIRLQNNSNVTVGYNDIDVTGRVGIWGGNISTANIHNNKVQHDGLGGYGSIHADGGSNWTVANNDIDYGDYGIFLNGVGGTANVVGGVTSTLGNLIDNVSADGIRIINTAGLSVAHNKIGQNGGNVGGNGIFVDPSNVAQLYDNIILNVGSNGIWSLNNDDANIYHNTITGAGLDGILVQGGNNVTVGGADSSKGNIVTKSGDDGIDVEGTTGTVVVKHNVVNQTGLNAAPDEDQNGIEVSGTTNAVIELNRITKAAWDGINVQQSSGTQIKSNQILDTLGASGIGVHNGVSNITIDDNVITKAKQFGMWLGGLTGTLTVTNNDISGITQSDGIYVNSSTGTIKLNNNDIYNVGRHGIWGTADIDEVNSNRVLKTGQHGILITNSENVDIKDNKVGNSITGTNAATRLRTTNGTTISHANVNATSSNIGDDGIHVEGSSYAEVLNNQVGNTVDDGIFITLSDNSVVAVNTLTALGNDGIESFNNSQITIGGATAADGNIISRAGAHGINVQNGSSALVKHNQILGGNAALSGFTLTAGTAGAQLDGIHVENNDSVEILSNLIAAGQGLSITLPAWLGGATIGANGGNGANQHGVYVSGSNNAVIDQNNVTGDILGSGMGAGVDGIHVAGSNILTVGGMTPVLNGNKIFSTGNDGIYIDGSNGAFVLNNIIGGVPFMDVAGDGVDVQNTLGTLVAGNIITNVGGDGIQLSDSALSAIALNFINGAGDDGIDISNTALFLTALNQIGDAGDNGIELFNTYLGLVGWNNIDGSANDGIKARIGSGLLITGNEVTDSGDDGIDAGLVSFTGITNNKVTGAADNGIQMFLSAFSTIEGNEVEDVNNDGISATLVAFTDIKDNKVTNAGDDGIDVTLSAFTDISGNSISDVSDDGIDLSWSVFSSINDNTVDNTGDNGIEVRRSAFVQIDNNDVGLLDTIGRNGIDVRNVYDVEITNNDIGTFVNRNGIRVGSSDLILIEANTIDGVGRNGIRLHNNAGDAEVLSNLISNSGARGLFASGANNGSIVVSDNTFTNNPIGAEFQSGVIDLTGAGNRFIGGDVALRFAPYNLGGLPPGFANLTLVNDGNPAYGGTIGSQTFFGQSKAYVELANGAFYNPGTPTLLNALNSTYDIPGDATFRPADNGGVLSQAEYDYLESRFFHYPDGQLVGENLGRFFFGYVPDNALLFSGDQKDLFNTFGAFNGDLTGLNVRITGLPNIPGAPANTNPGAIFNSIQTYAGGTAPNSGNPADLNNIETAAGGNTGSNTSAQDLNNIETQSGEQDTQCWGDAMSVAGSGQVANVVYQGSMADNLDQAACSGAI